MKCLLCKLIFENDIKTELLYKDKFCTITYCSTHRSQPMVVLNRHSAQPNKKELEHIKKICKEKFPNKKFRGRMQSIPDHFHEHLI